MTMRLGILGAGGLGKGMLQRANLAADVTVLAMADSHGYVFEANGLQTQAITSLQSLAEHPDHVPSAQAVLDLLKTRGDELDALFVALPNLPVEFIPELTEQIATQTPFKGVIVDALKRTSAVELLLQKSETLRQRNILYITGAGATPGFLSTVAAVAAQSFVKVERIEIRFGVGVSNWQAYRATIREDFLHLEGFDAERAATMTDAEIEAELEKRHGVLELVNMEHADDIILELAGICPRENVVVGGLVDTRNAKKPISTTVTITGKTVSGEIGSHVLTLADQTTMVDNVCGPALGFARQGLRLRQQGLAGIVTSADVMPRGDVSVAVPALVG